MLVGLFAVEKVLPLKDKNIILLEGLPVGQITAGMYYRIPLNQSFGMTVQINEIKRLCGDRLQLISCFEKEEMFDLIFSMDISEEVFDILDAE